MNWTNKEEETLRIIYRATTPEAMCEALPRHTRAAITTRANKLGLHKAEPPKVLPPIIKALLARRKELGFSQDHMAERAGLKRPQISKYESGASFPGLASLEVLCRALKVELTIRPVDEPA